MLFNSVGFALFLPLVFFLYWFVTKTTRSQNLMLLVASYFFYGCWDWRFLFLLAFSTGLDYFTGLRIYEAPTKAGKKTWLLISVVINVGFLAVFKYYNFFSESFTAMAKAVGFTVNPGTINVILPVGISFYTFHGLSYVFDIYNGRIKPTTNLVNYTLFVSFFPLLVAGPIERATHLLPQLEKPRTFNYSQAVDGLKQILWGLFKKVVIADNCASLVNEIFFNSTDFSAPSLWLGAMLFAFQIYGDFSGYSDIALGTARLFGIELLRNFAYPYFSRDIAEFWRRWHISLSSWFKDYLYIPLGGSKGSTFKRVRNTFIIFLVSGFWHGASLNFIIWGFLNALYIVPSIVFRTNRDNLEIAAKGRLLPSVKELLKIALTFALTCIAWVFFRGMGVRHAVSYTKKMLTDWFTPGAWSQMGEFIQTKMGYPLVLLIVLLFATEWIGREKQHALQGFGPRTPRVARWAFYYALIAILMVYAGAGHEFIYFQF